jgi:hypothetical protein
MLLQQMLRIVPTLTTTAETRCNCQTNVNDGGGRRFDHAMECYKDEDVACGVRLDEELMRGILCRRRQQRMVIRHDAVAKVLTTRLHSLPGATEASANGGTAWSEGGPERGGEGAQVALGRRRCVPRHQVSGGQT